MDGRRPQTLMVTTLDRWNPGDTLFRSTDGGKTWTDLAPENRARLVPDSLPDLRCSDSAGSAGGSGRWRSIPSIPVTLSTEQGRRSLPVKMSPKPTRATPHTGTVGAAGLEETAVITLVSPPTGAHLISGLGDIGGFRHDDLTVSPKSGMYTNPVFTNTDSIDFAEADPRLVARVGRGGRGTNGAFSTDNGVTWTPFATAPTGSRGSGSIAVSADGGTLVWAAQGRRRPSHAIMGRPGRRPPQRRRGAQA